MTTALINPQEVAINRNKIAAIKVEVKKLPQLNIELSHHFADRVYGREGTIPAGSITVARIHKQSQIQILLTGSMSMFTETGMTKIVAPCVWVAPAGIERTTFYHEDTRRVTIIGTEEVDPVVIFNTCTEETYQDYLLSSEEVLKLKDN